MTYGFLTPSPYNGKFSKLMETFLSLDLMLLSIMINNKIDLLCLEEAVRVRKDLAQYILLIGILKNGNK